MAGTALEIRPAGEPHAVALKVDERTVFLPLDRGRTYRLIGGEPGRLALIDQLSDTGVAALVPCEGGLIGNLKVWENLSLPLAWQARSGTGQVEARARTMLALLGVSGEQFTRLCRAFPEQLSRLECRMVAFVRAVLLEPEILVYDRLFEGLTRSQRAQAPECSDPPSKRTLQVQRRCSNSYGAAMTVIEEAN